MFLFDGGRCLTPRTRKTAAHLRLLGAVSRGHPAGCGVRSSRAVVAFVSEGGRLCQAGSFQPSITFGLDIVSDSVVFCNRYARGLLYLAVARTRGLWCMLNAR
jgi:hypothetical protein